MRTLIVLSIVLTALALGAGLAHLYALPNKMAMSREDYLISQQVYRGWVLIGIMLVGALITTAILAVRTQGMPFVFGLSVAAATCIALSLVVFFVFTYPANAATENWTRLPEDWVALRRQWEYSHAVNAVLYLVALALLAVVAVNWSDRTG